VLRQEKRCSANGRCFSVDTIQLGKRALLQRKLKLDVTLVNLVARVADDLFSRVRINLGVCQPRYKAVF
jgi:hypothetical protein